ncbi:hypothetical protein [Dyella nitratireducens]|uniref:Uncharacterized protein n=1 Tax=Dyella nitratireducens TaxID=1849580 RepID=A0ABQ1GAB9_9GAMM|nr:hypothetical protein [Dyella nitratireducens]GGA39861.1 hypothetical protein GCM10010981_31400 [Dyella nitratireducens]GLQ40497.1 hypothetical protein GCM10007902_03460 [Dyella nitratireducens]
MKNAYLYAYSLKNVSQDEISDFFDKIEGIDDWFYCIPNTIFLVGSVPARMLSQLVLQQFGSHRHFITLISKKARAGWLPKEYWPRIPSKSE